MTRVSGLEKQGAMLNGNETLFTGYFSGGGNAVLAVVVKGKWGCKDSLLLGDVILPLLFCVLFFQLEAKAGLHFLQINL